MNDSKHCNIRLMEAYAWALMAKNADMAKWKCLIMGRCKKPDYI
jgi:hypothetical protein